MQSQNFILESVYPTTRRKRKATTIVWLSIIGIVLFGFILLIVFSYREYQNSPKLVEGRAIHSSEAQQYSLSVDQEAVVSQLGYPDSFSITFYREEFDPVYKGEARDEIWRYYGEGTAYNFYNGRLEYQESIPNAPTNFLPALYQPDQFVAYAKLKSVLASNTIKDYFELPLEKGLVNHGKLYYAPGLTFGLAKDRLIYVETISMEIEGE